jgi:hypothetical protein
MRMRTTVSFVIVIVITVALSIGVPLAVTHYTPFANTTENLEFASIILSSISSAILVVLYFWLANIQSKQQKLMEANQEPVIEVLDTDGYGRYLMLRMRNIGNGITREMGVKIHLYAKDDLRIETRPEPLGHMKDSKVFEDSDVDTSEISSLAPGERGRLAAGIHVSSLENKDEIESFGGLTEELTDLGVDKVIYQIEIYYDHLMRTKGTARIYLRPKQSKIRGGMGVNTFVENSDNYTNTDIFGSSSNFRRSGTYYDD